MNLETKMNSFKISFIFFILLVFPFLGSAQDCTLDIGGKNTDMLIDVFQLNAQQISQMETWRAELAIETKIIEEAIQKLFETQPQSTPEELTALADKYKVLKEKMVKASAATDKKLLEVFNKKQYERYLGLCTEALRRPIKVVPLGVHDTIVDPE
jgi:hypothetical protein